MPLKRLGKPPFIDSDDVEDGDILTVAEPPYLVDAEQSKFGKERYRIVVAKDDDRDWGLKTWTLNITTWNRLLDQYGPDEKTWPGKQVRVRVKDEVIRGVTKTVLYGEPYLPPQQKNLD